MFYLEKKWLMFSVLFFSLSSVCHADLISLKTGEVIDGNITTRADQYIVVEIEGKSLAYFHDEIESIQKQNNDVIVETVQHLLMDEDHYENGQLKCESHFSEGILIKKIEYFENGKHKKITKFKFDKRHGIEKMYYENGILKSETVYENDKKVSKKKYHKDGSLLYLYS